MLCGVVFLRLHILTLLLFRHKNRFQVTLEFWLKSHYVLGNAGCRRISKPKFGFWRQEGRPYVPARRGVLQ